MNYEFHFPLAAGKTASISLPNPLTLEEYDLVIETLNLWRPMLVKWVSIQTAPVPPEVPADQLPMVTAP